MSIPASESNRSPKDLAYGNWIRKRVLWSLGLAVLAALALAAAPVYPALRLSGALLAVALLVSLSFPLYAYYAFSPAGGNLQDRVYQLLIDSLRPWPIGPALDIGAGNGVLAIKLSLANPDSRVTGIDYWGRAGSTRSPCARTTRTWHMWMIGSHSYAERQRACPLARTSLLS